MFPTKSFLVADGFASPTAVEAAILVTCSKWLLLVCSVTRHFCKPASSQQLWRRAASFGTTKVTSSIERNGMCSEVLYGRFHQKHGTNIQILEDGRIAHRKDSYNKAVVFSEQSISIGNMFQVKILDKGGGWAGALVRDCTRLGEPRSYVLVLGRYRQALQTHWATCTRLWQGAGKCGMWNYERILCILNYGHVETQNRYVTNSEALSCNYIINKILFMFTIACSGCRLCFSTHSEHFKMPILSQYHYTLCIHKFLYRLTTVSSCY